MDVRARSWSLGLLGVMLGVLGSVAVQSRSAPPATSAPAAASVDLRAEPPPVPPPSPAARTEDEDNTVAVFRAMAPATVFVTQSQNQLVLDRYALRAMEVPTGTGSGFLWDDQGHVVTNYHVIDGAASLSVTLQDQSVWPAKLLGGDPNKDVAVLKIDAPTSVLVPVKLPPAGYELEVGQKTLAIGNPFGLDHTLTTGVISALGREIVGYGGLTIKGMIQTDASINPGNSGGPLLDSSGQLIGMNSMIYSQAGQSAGIGFAVPYTLVDRVVSQIVATGEVARIGIGGIDLLEDRIARRYRIQGVAVLQVQPNTPAAQAGLRGLTPTRGGATLGDVIVGIDGQKIRNYDDFYNALDPHRPGEKVRLRLVRDGKEWETEVALVDVNANQR